MKDLLSNAFTCIRNGQKAHKEYVIFPSSKFIDKVLEILIEKGYINSIEEVVINKKNFIKVILKYDRNQRGTIKEIKRVSKQSRRVYVGKEDVPRIRNGYGVAIISTSKGLLTGKESREKGLGGEVICHVF